MKLKLIDMLGDWNPQLMREIKGNCTLNNLLIAGAISVVGQVLFYMMLRSQLPLSSNEAKVFHKYCTGNITYEGLRECILDNVDNFIINWQFWWLNLFVSLSAIGIFTLIVGGTYLLINDLCAEQRRGTLNFLLLSPQSPQVILIGKLLGVPILLYFVAFLAIPLHLKAGLAAQVPLQLIVGFYATLIAGCVFFYSTALLFSLVFSSLATSAWVGSGAVLLFLWMTSVSPPTGTLADWLFLFSPNQIIPYLSAATHLTFYPGLSMPALNAWQWFYLPLGANVMSLVGAIVLNYSLWTYWLWQALQRRFPNPRKTLLSKRQSYGMVACFEVIILGFATVSIQGIPAPEKSLYNFQFILVFNLMMFLALIVSMTPSHQVVQDWARYRNQSFLDKKLWRLSLIKDLMWGERSPAVLAILFNLAIASFILSPWILFNLRNSNQSLALFSLLISSNFILICTTISQIIVLRTIQKTGFWVAIMLSTITILPAIILNLINRYYLNENLTLWLFTPYAWVAINSVSQASILLAILVQWGILGLCTLQLLNDIKKAGESTSKALFT
ncbi:hypothetical protein Glo7428_2642 [Gloeocapsa sp. PCC 7428]|uniref:ABC transporter permease subunit n=1 Tax=Gloeocapsa sp. PCC 7428 TaxID=1173026 RepID=UPI0002A5D92F|nr:ABC transporter permease subunit [Gloeocapsa sp. PCC 7428]AFZ31144.1 hypothetical protein Glo7428_2642 [Gloeocapsa sp. PCC 7428]